MISRRMLLAVTAFGGLSACTTVPATAATDINLIANAINTEKTALLAISGLSAAQQTQISNDIATAVAAAQALTGTFVTSTGTFPTTFTSAVGDLVNFLQTPVIVGLLPPGAAQVIAAVAAVLPAVEAAFGITSTALRTPPVMSPATGRIILAAVHG